MIIMIIMIILIILIRQGLSVETRKLRRSLAWPPRKDDAHKLRKIYAKTTKQEITKK